MEVPESRRGFEEFVRARLPRLVLHVVKLGAGIEQAKDAVSEALAEAYQKWSTIDAPDAWVRSAAAHIFVRAARRDRDGISRAVEGGHLPAPGTPADGLDTCGEEAATVLRHLRQLPFQQRTVMALTYDGFKPGEIAAMMGTAEETVRSNLRHARRRLRQSLLPVPPGGPDPGAGAGPDNANGEQP